jgi:hypothetical protein
VLECGAVAEAAEKGLHAAVAATEVVVGEFEGGKPLKMVQKLYHMWNNFLKLHR